MDYIRYQTTPERVRTEAQRNERDQRVLDSPEHHRTPHHVRIARLGASVAPIPPPIFMPPPLPRPAPVYSNLPAHLAQQYAALPPLQPRRQASVAPVDMTNSCICTDMAIFVIYFSLNKLIWHPK